MELGKFIKNLVKKRFTKEVVTEKKFTLNTKGYRVPDGIAADMLVITEKDGEICALMIERMNSPLGYAIPGGFLESTEDLSQCALREAREETGLSLSREDIQEVGTFSAPDRDPRGWIISTAYVTEIPYEELLSAKAGDDAFALEFVPVQRVLDGQLNLAFKDHKDMVERGLKLLGK